MATLADQGFRFVCRAGQFKWVHPCDKLATDFDCTNMTDGEFETFVKAVKNWPSSQITA